MKALLNKTNCKTSVLILPFIVTFGVILPAPKSFNICIATDDVIFPEEKSVVNSASKFCTTEAFFEAKTPCSLAL